MTSPSTSTVDVLDGPSAMAFGLWCTITVVVILEQPRPTTDEQPECDCFSASAESGDLLCNVI